MYYICVHVEEEGSDAHSASSMFDGLPHVASGLVHQNPSHNARHTHELMSVHANCGAIILRWEVD